jgi:hypothetical protein
MKSINDFQEKCNLLKGFVNEEISVISHEGKYCVGTAYLVTLTKFSCGEYRDVDIYTNTDLYVDIKNSELKEGIYNNKKYYVLTDCIGYNKSFILGFDFSTVYDTVFKPYLDNKQELKRNVDMFLGMSN